jgi:hypothetical protein
MPPTLIRILRERARPCFDYFDSLWLLRLRSAQVRSAQVRSAQVRSGQVRAGRNSGRRGSPPSTGSGQRPCGNCLSAAFLGNITTVSYSRPTAGLAGCEVCGEVSDLWGYAVERGTLVKPPPGGIAKTKLDTPMGNLSETENPDCEVRNPRRLRRGGCQLT